MCVNLGGYVVVVAFFSGADKDSTVECCGEAFARTWKVLEAGKCASFGMAWSP